MRLAEPEGRERAQHVPHPLDGGQVVATPQGRGVEPGPDVVLALDGPERAARLVGLGQRASGHGGDDAQHLLVEHDHAAGLLECGPEVVVQVDRLVPALAGAQERSDHVGLHRPGPEQGDVDDEVAEGLGRELADELALSGRLDLEAAEGLRRRDERERLGIVEAVVVEGDALAGRALDLVDRMGHRRLHADAEHIELEQAHLLDVVLVEVAHREARGAGLDGSAIEQGGVGQHHSARMQRHMPREAIELLDEVEEGVEPAGGGQPAEARRAQLGQVGEGVARVTGPDVREGLGEGVDVADRHPQGGADVADRVPHAVGLHHRHAGGALRAEAVEDPLVDLRPAGGLHVDVDVGQRPAQR